MSRHILHAGNNTLHSEQIRAEIQRFESVHPCIYQVYDLLNSLPDQYDALSTQLREQVVAIEDAFVNSHEWTLSRSISEMRLGIVGTTTSGKTSLVHRYLTGTYTTEESPEGGRFKKEVVIEGQSHLLLIRDEGQQHLDVQFCQWVDAVVFVFSVCCEESFESILLLAHEMSKFRNISDLPILLVGTKDTINEKRPRVISEMDGHKLAGQMKRCIYYETCSTIGNNVERVFKDACCKIIHQRIRSAGSGGISQNTRTPTPTHQQQESSSNNSSRKDYQDPRYMATSTFAVPSSVRPTFSSSAVAPSSASRRSGVVHHRDASMRSGSERSMSAMLNSNHANSYGRQTGTVSPSSSQKSVHSIANGIERIERGSRDNYSRSSAALLDSDGPHSTYSMDAPSTPYAHHQHHQNYHQQQQQQQQYQQYQQPASSSSSASHTLGHTSSQVSASTSHLPTPSSTPNTQRKNRRISNIFQRPKDKESHDEKTKVIEGLNLGVGRAIPVKQGILYKKSTKSALNREWKKKYVCLHDDGRLTYHTSLKEYMDKSVTGKQVFLGLATVKVSGRQRPRNTQRASAIGTLGGAGTSTDSGGASGTPTLKSYETRRSDFGVANSGEATSGGGSDDAIKENKRTSNIGNFTPPVQPMTVPGKKKRDTHRRIGSSGKNNDEDDECFEVVTHNQQRWEFCAGSTEERDEWVSAIEEHIELALTAQSSQPTTRATASKAQVHALRSIAGNDRCADCGQTNPDWASLNLGTLICIECSGIHRNLGSHVSKVRSLELDGWPVEHMAVMQSIGNDVANRMWEYNVTNEKKPTPESCREEKERWIDRKYQQKCFLEPISTELAMDKQLVGVVLARDVQKTCLLLANGITPEQINMPLSGKDLRTVLHLASSIGSLEILLLLIWHGGDLKALDEQGRSCLWYAQNNGWIECAEVLVACGLESGYGCPKSCNGNYGGHTTTISFGGAAQLPENAVLGSMSNRDYSYIEDEVYSRRPGAPQVPRRSTQSSTAHSELDMSII